MATIIKMLLGAKIEKIFYLLYLCRHILKKTVMISVENLQVEFGGFTLFDDVSFVINKKDRIALVGKNGAGKSTLFNSIAGNFLVDSGRILLDDENITFTPEYKRSKYIGRLFQDPLRGTAPHMTIRENLALAYLLAGKHT